jgi:hypothetical protein
VIARNWSGLQAALRASTAMPLLTGGPIGSMRIGRTERRATLLREAVRVGRNAAWNELAGCIEPLVRDGTHRQPS